MTSDSFRDDVVRAGVVLLAATLVLSALFVANLDGLLDDSVFSTAMVAFDVVVIVGLGYLGLRYRQERDA